MLTDNTLNHVNADDNLRKVNILFLGGAKRVSMGRKFIEAGRRMGMDVRLYSYELSPYVPIACIAEVIIGLKWADPEVTAHIHGIIEQKGIDILVPFVDGAVEVAARCRDEYGDVWVPVGDAALSARMFDKVEADSLFRSLDLPVPGLEKFPLIAKPRFGSASKGLIIIHDAAELDALGERARDYLIQECITRRKEITVDCYVTLEGEIITAVSRYRIDVQDESGAWTTAVEVSDNHQRFVRHALNCTAKAVRLVPLSTYHSERKTEDYGSSTAHIFAFEVY